MQMTPDLFAFMSALLYDKTNSFLTSIESHLVSQLPSAVSLDAIEADLEVSRLALKTLRRLLVNGFPEKNVKEYDHMLPVCENQDAVVCMILVSIHSCD